MKKAMKKAVRMIALVLVLLMAFTGCGKTSVSSESSQGSATPANATPPATENKEVKDVIVNVFTYMEIPDDSTALESINAIMNPLGVNIVFEWTTSKLFWDQLPLKISSGEQVDLCPIADYRVAGYIDNGSLMELDDLFVEYGKDIPAAFGNDYSWILDATITNGHRYTVPTLNSKFAQVYCALNADLVKKYNIDLNSIKTYKDLTPVFDKIHESEPSVKTLIPATMPFSCINARMLGCDDFEGLGDGIGVLMGKDNWKVVNVYETPEYADMCKQLHAWFDAGYISSDVMTSNETIDTYWKTGNAFACIRLHDALNGEIGGAMATKQYGVNTTMVPISSRKAVFLRYQQAIPVTSKNPEGAMTFINELYKNPELIDIVYRGKKDVDWKVNKDDCVSLVEGASYPKNIDFQQHFGDYFLSQDIDTTYKGYINDCEDAMKTCDVSRSLGFMFNTSKVNTQYTAVQNVVKEFSGLEYGSSDPDVELPKFINKLKGAGIDDIITEKQVQLDAWVKAQKK